MTHPQLILPRIVQSPRVKSIRTSAALTLITLTLLVVAGATTATAQTYTDLYNFNVSGGDTPWVNDALLVQGRDGNLYSTSSHGGTHDLGFVFKITVGAKLTVLYSFDGVHGSYPYNGLTLGTDGNFYGTTFLGGANNWGTIFKITPSGSLTILYSFTNGTDGNSPWSPPIQAADGNFYGTTCGCPNFYGSFAGTMYKLTPSGNLTTLHQFGLNPVTDGVNPQDPLVQAMDGSLYGTTTNQGRYNSGTIFKITPAGEFKTIYSFDPSLGARTYGRLIQDSDGNFYAPGRDGGKFGDGVVYEINSAGKFTAIHTFDGSDGRYEWAGLALANDGNFYGTSPLGGATNHGTIYRISPDGSFSVLYDFDGTTGSQAYTTLLQHTNGTLYGLTYSGGAHNDGVFYSFDVGLPPFVNLVSTTGEVGASIKVLGEGLTGTTAVSFNGTPATFKVWADTYLAATVPSGATTGPVTVTTPTGVLTSNHGFRVHPVILAVTPASGAAGTPVVIAGTSFTQTTKVAFGGGATTASFTVDSDTQITATVPAGAPTGYIVLTTAGGKSRSPDTFTVTQ